MKLLKSLWEFCSTWTGAIILALLLIFFFAQAFTIPTRSMVGTFLEGDFLFVKKFSYGIPLPRAPYFDVVLMPDFRGNGHIIEGERPKKGEVVVFIPPIEQTHYVKRVYGVGGDEVIFTKEGYFLRPNGGDEEISKMYPHAQKREFFGKTFIKDPFIEQFNGIMYEEVFWHKDDVNPFTRPAARTKYFYDEKAMKFYKKVCAQGEIKISDADMRADCDLFEKSFSDEEAQNFVLVKNITYEEMLSPKGIDTKMSKHTQNGETFFYIKIEPDNFFMTGDNRNNSFDSRFFGSVPYKDIVGKPWFIYFSINRANSEEMGADMDKKKRYIVRWERMFKGTNGLDNLAQTIQENKKVVVPMGVKEL
ncbi:signal peptidase I [Helicobacter sp. 23-1048]